MIKISKIYINNVSFPFIFWCKIQSWNVRWITTKYSKYWILSLSTQLKYYRKYSKTKLQGDVYRTRFGICFNYGRSYPNPYFLQKHQAAYAIITETPLIYRIKVYSTVFRRDFDVLKDSLGILKSIHDSKCSSVSSIWHFDAFQVLCNHPTTKFCFFDRKWIISILRNIYRLFDQTANGEDFESQKSSWSKTSWFGHWRSQRPVDRLLLLLWFCTSRVFNWIYYL